MKIQYIVRSCSPPPIKSFLVAIVLQFFLLQRRMARLLLLIPTFSILSQLFPEIPPRQKGSRLTSVRLFVLVSTNDPMPANRLFLSHSSLYQQQSANSFSRPWHILLIASPVTLEHGFSTRSVASFPILFSPRNQSLHQPPCFHAKTHPCNVLL